MNFTRKELSRFWDKVEKSTGCWNWSACKLKAGYGRFMFRGKSNLAHRISKMISGAVVPNDMLVLHSCDNPKCVNPNHLRIGTHGDNSKERSEKGRCNAPSGKRHRSVTHPETVYRGEDNPTSKLKESDVVKILILRIRDGVQVNKIATQFNISRRTVPNIISGKSWKHVMPEYKQTKTAP